MDDKKIKISGAVYLAVCLFCIVFIFGKFQTFPELTQKQKWIIEKADADQLAESLSWAPTDWASWYYLGLKGFSTSSKDGYKFCEHNMTVAAELYPNNIMIWESLAILRYQLKMDNAEEALNQYLEFYPESDREKHKKRLLKKAAKK